MTTDTDATMFAVAEHPDGLRVVMTTRETHATPGYRTPLWWTGLRDDDDLDGLAVWIGERENQWPEWRRIAEDAGGEAIAAHIRALWTASPVERPQCVLLARDEDDGRRLDIRVPLVTHTASVITHVFASEAHRSAFFDWIFEGELEAKSWSLAMKGSLHGRAELAAALDGIADERLARKRGGKRRSRGRPTR